MVPPSDLCAGFYTGYGVKTIPGVREAIEEKQWDEVDAESKKASDVIKALTSQGRGCDEDAGRKIEHEGRTQKAGGGRQG
jgi:hypothetical protein